MSCVLGDRRGQDVGLVCYQHHDRIADLLDPRNTGSEFNPARPGDTRVVASIPVLYRQLSAERGSNGIAVFGPPAFGSRSPADDTVLVLRDHRSRPDVVGPDDVDPAPRPTLLVLRGIVRELEGPRPSSVVGASSWLYGSLRALVAVPWVTDAWSELRGLSGALRAANGDPPPSSVGTCRVLVDDEGREDPSGPWRCAVPLYLPELPPRAMDEPFAPPSLQCGGCGHRYTGGELVDIAKAPLVAPR